MDCHGVFYHSTFDVLGAALAPLHFLSLSPGQTCYSEVVSTDPMERILPSTNITVLYMSQALVSMPTLVLGSFPFPLLSNLMNSEFAVV